MNTSTAVIGFPSVYIQGPNALQQLRGQLHQSLNAQHALVVTDPVVAHLFEAPSAAGDPDVSLEVLHFSGECTEAEVQRLCRLAHQPAPQAVVGAGGGKALDVAKAVSLQLNLPLMIVPTAASSDAPTSRLIALYDEQHRIVAVPTLRRNPDVVLVDTGVIARAPRRLLVAGIGDAITKRHEVSRALEAGVVNYCGGKGTGLSLLLAEQAYYTLRRDTAKALEAQARGEPDAAFERVVEAAVLYSGLAFESGGLCIAHGLLRGLTARAETQQALHGELVAYGLLIQLRAFEHDESEIEDLMHFYREIGLPTRCRDIGLPVPDASQALELAERTMTAPYVAAWAPRLHASHIAQALLTHEERAA